MMDYLVATIAHRCCTGHVSVRFNKTDSSTERSRSVQAIRRQAVSLTERERGHGGRARVHRERVGPWGAPRSGVPGPHPPRCTAVEPVDISLLVL